MAANTDNTQINSFYKGMNSDLSYSIIQDGQYVRGENVRVTGLNQVGEANLTNGVGEIRPIEGVKVEESNLQPLKILATGSIRDIGVIVYQAAEDNTWKVAVFRNGDAANITTIFESEEEPQVDKFSIVLHHEIEGIDKLYIADGINPIKLLLIEKDGDGNWKNITKEEVKSYPKIIFNAPVFEGFCSGQLKSGSVQYAYRLYKKYSIATDISPTTNLIPIVNKNTYDGYRADYKSNTGISLSFTINKDYSFLDRIQIYRIHYVENGQLPIISLIYDDYIYLLSHPESNNNPHVIDNIWLYDDTGVSELGVITLEEFNSMSGIHIIPKVIENKNDYMFAAQIKDAQSDVFDTTNVKGEYRLVDITLIGDGSENNSSVTQSDGSYYEENGSGNFGGNSVDGGSSGSVYGGSRSGSGSTGTGFGGRHNAPNRSSSSGVYLQRHNTIKRSVNVSDWNFNAKYTDDWSDVDNDQFEEIQSYMSSNPTYKNPKVSYYLKSLRRGETYRFGVVFFDEYGNSSGAINLGDVTIPEFEDLPTFEFGNAYELIVHPIGIEWTISGIPENAVAYEIVRCRRKEENIKNISQGVLSRPIKKYGYISGDTGFDDNYPYTPTGFLTLQDFAYGARADLRGGILLTPADRCLAKPDVESTVVLNPHADNYDNHTIFLFVSPETTYSPDLLIQEKKSQDINLNLQELLYSNPGNLYPSGSFGTLPTDTTYSNYYAAVNNTMLYIYPYTYTFGGNNDGDGMYKLCVSNSDFAKQFYKIHGSGFDFDSESDLPFSFVPPTEDVILGSKSQQAGDSIQAAVLLSRDDKSIKNIKLHAYSYIKLYNSISLSELNNGSNGKIKTVNADDTFVNKIKISSAILSNDLQWNLIFEYKEDNVTNLYEDYVQVVGQDMYNNVVIGGYYGEDIKGRYKSSKNYYDGNYEDDYLFVANGGRCAIIRTESLIPTLIPNTESHYEIQPEFMYTLLCSIQKEPLTYGQDKLSVYYSYGDYHLIKTTSGSCKTISFIGDTFIEPFEYVSMHKMYWSGAWDTVASHMVAYSIPVETSINLAYTNGLELSNGYKENPEITNLQVLPANVYNVFSQEYPLYSYNNAYSEDTTAKVFASRKLLTEDNSQKNIDYRVYHSQLKLNGEYIDNWLKYQASNYLDLNSKYGLITHLRRFHDKLIFWQEQATGLLSVNERAQITDDNNLPLILGTGGILSRYDYLDDTAGMKEEQYCDTMSDTTLYWYDDDNNEMRAYADGNGIVQLNKVYGTLNLMHEYDDDNTPWMFYDKKYNEAVLDLSNNPKWSIAYNEQIKAFTSLYNVGFDGAITFKDGIYLLNTQSGGETAVEIITKKVPKEQDNQNQQELQTQLASVVPRRNKMTPIDLGLSVKWGDRYLDAPDEYSEGLHTGWGDITGNINGTDYSKYINGLTNISGNPQYDIATAKLGDGWRLPTREEYLELVRSEDLTWYYNYNAGYFRAEAKNGNSVIFAYTSIKENDGSPVKDSSGSILFNNKNHMYAWLGDMMKSFSDSCAYNMNIHILSPEKTDEKQILKLSYWGTPVGSTVCNKLCVRPVYDGPDIEEEEPIITPSPVQPQPVEPEYETIQEVKYITSGANLQLGKWNEGDVTNFDGKIKSRLQYVVNKNPLTTKVFDNLEIISDYHDNLWTDHSYFTSLHKYNFKSDLNESDDVYHLMMTTREGNYRYAVPRAKYQTWGNRIRGKYMLCTIESAAPEVEASIKYIITKFRTSWS